MQVGLDGLAIGFPDLVEDVADLVCPAALDRDAVIDSRQRGKQAGAATRAVAEMVDLYPTLADLCGFEKPAHLVGKSLAAVLADPASAGKEAAYTVSSSRGRGPELQGQQVLGRTIRTQRYRYTIWGDDGQFGVDGPVNLRAGGAKVGLTASYALSRDLSLRGETGVITLRRLAYVDEGDELMSGELATAGYLQLALTYAFGSLPY